MPSEYPAARIGPCGARVITVASATCPVELLGADGCSMEACMDGKETDVGRLHRTL